MPGIGHLLAAASVQAAKNHSELTAKWRDVYNGLVRINADLARFQSDLWVDLILRSLEDELAARLAAGSAAPIQEAVVLADGLQHTLTRYWVLGTHDVLRMAKTGAGEHHPKLPTVWLGGRCLVPVESLKRRLHVGPPRDKESPDKKD